MFSTKSDKLVPLKQTILQQKNKKKDHKELEQQQWLSSSKIKQNSLHPFTAQQLFYSEPTRIEKQILKDSLSFQFQNNQTNKQKDLFQISCQTRYEQIQIDNTINLKNTTIQNLDETLQPQHLNDKERGSKDKIQGQFLKRLKNIFNKYIINSINSTNFLKQMIKGEYNQVDQSSFNCDATINDSSFNSLIQYNNERRMLIAQKKRQKQKTIFDLQEDQKKQTQNNYRI